MYERGDVCVRAGRQVAGQAGEQAGRWEGEQEGRRVGRQEGGRAAKKAGKAGKAGRRADMIPACVHAGAPHTCACACLLACVQGTDVIERHSAEGWALDSQYLAAAVDRVLGR